MKKRTKEAPADSSAIVSPTMLAFERGRKMFRDGIAAPECDKSDETWRKALDPREACWLGWMVERGLALMKQWKIRDWAEHGGRLT